MKETEKLMKQVGKMSSEEYTNAVLANICIELKIRPKDILKTVLRIRKTKENGKKKEEKTTE